MKTTPMKEKVEEVETSYNFVPIDNVSENYIKAVVAVEDRRYYEHGPVDYIGLARALITNVKSKSLKEGGSTITQQTAKNLFYINEDSLKRKGAELFTAIELEKEYSKKEILELYINTIYFGSGYYGIKDASLGYLNKQPSDLNIPEAAMLAGLPNAPSLYSPKVDKNLCKSRTRKVINSLVSERYITKEKADSFSLDFIDNIN